MNNQTFFAIAGLFSVCACASHIKTLSEQPKETVSVYFKDGRRTDFPANSVTKVVYTPAPKPPLPPREHVLVEVSGEKDGRLVDVEELKGVRIDRSAIHSPEWERVIAITKEIPSVRVGNPVTLMRVMLETNSANEMIGLSSIKLNDPWEAKSGGGGMVRRVGNGDFVLIEHINSTYRRQGKDPVRIGSFQHQHVTLWVELPAHGTVGILGDVILSPCAETEMGRVEATVLSETPQPLEIRTLRISPGIDGGGVSRTLKFDADHTCDTGKIVAGTYNVFLPDFDVMQSRWTVHVAPGMVTRLRFVARSQRQIDMVEEDVVADTNSSKP